MATFPAPPTPAALSPLVPLNSPMVGFASPFDHADGQNRDIILESIRAWASQNLLTWSSTWQTFFTGWIANVDAYISSNSVTGFSWRTTSTPINSAGNTTVVINPGNAPLRIGDLVADQTTNTNYGVITALIDSTDAVVTYIGYLHGIAGPTSVPADTAVGGFIGSAGSFTQIAGDKRYKLYTNVLSYGAVADGVTDNTAAFVAAVAAAGIGGTVFAPAGVYGFTPTLNAINIPLTRGTRILGAGRSSTTFKMLGAAGVNWRAFIGSNTFGTDDLTGLEMSDFTFDYNTPNNPAVVSGLIRALVMAPKGSRIRIHDIDVINADGTWILELGGTYASVIISGYRCDDADIDINVIGFGAGSSYHDTSIVYIIGDRAKVRGTYRAAPNAPAAIAAVELHGSGCDVQVAVDGFVTLANLTGSDSASDRSTIAHDCHGTNLMNGFVMWSYNGIGATGYGMDGVHIVDNYIEINPDYWSGTGKPTPPGNFAHTGVILSDQGAAGNLPIRNIKIADNVIRYMPATTTVPQPYDSAITLVRGAPITAAHGSDQNIDIRGNTIDSPLAAGIYIDLQNQVDGFSEANNTIRNPASMGLTVGVTSAFATGLYLVGKFFGLNSDTITVIDTRNPVIAGSAVNAAGVSNINPATGRQQILDPTLVCLQTAAGPAPVIGPTGTGGVYLRCTTYGYAAPVGLFTYGSEIIDTAGAHTYRQAAAQGGTNWVLWFEIRPEGVALGAALVDPTTPTGMPYISLLNGAGPPGVPTVRGGMVPLVIDSNGKLWSYVNSIWRGVALT